MLTNERQDFILKLLNERQSVKIQDFVELTSASESTIRRDLTELESKGKLERVFGGAILPGRNLTEPSVEDKSTRNLQEKIRIARYAASFVKEGNSIYLDAGTTTFQMIPFLKEKNAVVVTNGLNLIESLNYHGITAYLTGGFMKARTGAFVGSHTLESLGNYRFDKCFLGVNGVHADYGYTTPDPEEAAVKKLACSLSRKSYVLADNSKLNTVSFIKITNLDKAALIVDRISSGTLAALEKQTLVKVVGE